MTPIPLELRTRRLTDRGREQLADIDRLIAENAALLGEEVGLGVRRLPKNRIRIQVRRGGRWLRGQHRDYLGIDAAHDAAVEANRRAHEVAKRRAAVAVAL